MIARGNVKNGIVEIVLQKNKTLRAVAYIYPDGDGRIELQRQLHPESEWLTVLTETKTVDEMRAMTLID